MPRIEASGLTCNSAAMGEALGLFLPPCLIIALTASWTALPFDGLYRACARVAIVLFVLCCLYSWLERRRSNEESAEGTIGRPESLWRIRGESILLITAASLFPVGHLTVPQAAAILALCILIITILNRDFGRVEFSQILTETLISAGSLMMLLFSALALNGCFAYTGVYTILQEWLGAIQSPASFLLAFNLVLFFLLRVLGPCTAVFLVGPLLPPSAAAFGLRWEQLAVILLLQIASSRLWLASSLPGPPMVRVRRWLAITIFLAVAIAVSFLPSLLGPELRR